MRCGKVRSTLDPRLQNLGISIPARRLLVLNPTLLQRHPHTVRLFVSITNAATTMSAQASSVPIAGLPSAACERGGSTRMD